MKKLLCIIAAVCMAVMYTSATAAEDSIYGEAKVSSAVNKNSTGFILGAIQSGCSLELSNGALLLNNGASASARARTKVSLEDWSSVKTSSFVAEINIKPEENEGTKRIYFDPAISGKEYEIVISGGKMSVGGKETNAVIENKWYTVDIIINADADESITVLLDGVKVGAYAGTDVSALAHSGAVLNIEVYGKSTSMSVGDTKIFTPADVEMYVDNSVIQSTDSAVDVSFDRAVVSAPENVSFAAEDGSVIAAERTEPVFDTAGNCKGFRAYPAEPFKKKTNYRVKAESVKGVLGQNVNELSDSFSVKVEDLDYSIEKVELYSGMPSLSKPVSSPVKGYLSMEITLANEGSKSGSGIITAELYDKSGNLIFYSGAAKVIDADERVSVKFGTLVLTEPGEFKVRLIDNFTDKNDLCEAYNGGGAE